MWVGNVQRSERRTFTRLIRVTRFIKSKICNLFALSCSLFFTISHKPPRSTASFTMASSTDTDTDTDAAADYCQEYLPANVVELLEAGAFRSLCRHLQEQSDTVANMDLMTLSGFCRNCLAKVRVSVLS